MLTGIKRSLRVKITRDLTGYPKYYPTDDDISQGYFTYSGVNYSIPDDNTLASMNQNDYNDLVDILTNYIWYNEHILTNSKFLNDNEEVDIISCTIPTADNIIITADSDKFTADNNVNS